ncbi:MAG TPA: lytic transglycosylase domain-containing protein, partial [Candidatus Dormibacteraeota bacterium]|nr:lytic transglycosylase domain-containing protein [Candidatus Dormibacteraeota bacterium]
FRTAGLPPELVTLAHVESGFHGGSRSSAGAVGIWQFTRDTGKHYMKITRYHDDRLIPDRATLAAAKLLRSNYDTLGDWPLAITAYNYGTGGVARAAGIYGGDYSEMVQHYQGPRFGFAVKNYYAEFLAAMQVHRYEDAYFPGIGDEDTIRPAPIKADFARPKSSKKSSHTTRVHHTGSKRHHSKKTVEQKT